MIRGDAETDILLLILRLGLFVLVTRLVREMEHASSSGNGCSLSFLSSLDEAFDQPVSARSNPRYIDSLSRYGRSQ